MPLATLDIRPPLARLSFNKPPVNVLNIALMTEAIALIARLEGRGVRALVLSGGAGKAFSAGVDVGEHMGDSVERMIRRFHELFRALAEAPCAVIASVQGACLGGAAELLLACDSVCVSEDATIGFPEIRLGVFPPIACALLPQAVGTLRARHMILTGETVSGPEAVRIGLATRVAKSDELDAAVLSEVELYTRHSSAALGHTRRALAAGVDLSKIENIYLRSLMKTADATEGLNAFMDKRPAKWTDR